MIRVETSVDAWLRALLRAEAEEQVALLLFQYPDNPRVRAVETFLRPLRYLLGPIGAAP